MSTRTARSDACAHCASSGSLRPTGPIRSTGPVGVAVGVALAAVLALGGCSSADRSEPVDPPAPTASTGSALDVEGFQLEGASPDLIDASAEALDVVGVDGVLLAPDGASVGASSDEARAQRDRAHDLGLDAQLLVSNFDDELGDFSEPLAAALLSSESRRASVVAALADEVAQNDWDSLMVDFEAMGPDEAPGLTAFVTELRGALPSGTRLDIALQASTTADGYADLGFDVPALADSVDHLTLMAYDQHGPWEPDLPGPVGALDWTTEAVSALAALAPADKIVLGVAGYGYRFGGPDEAAQMSDQEARDRADAAGTSPTWDDGAGEWTATLPSGEVLWWSDARSLDVRRGLAADRGLAGLAVWSLDLSDPLVGGA
jgi:spore germination protein